ncbi:hypothetical protein [Aureivirga marina]|uniref:hypothetical protein n=1 Tax=Aureivirga marina TaxID=1182451 RepID=UPI0018CB05F3|nr:hypothetical protein [Aureivirga marina]
MTKLEKVNMTIEWIKFSVVMLVFMLGMIYFTLSGIHNWIFWTFYIIVWWIVEARIAKRIHLHWFTWILIIGGLTLIDLWIISLLQ